MSQGTYSLQSDQMLTALANEIRAKTGGSSQMTVTQMRDAVRDMTVGGYSAQDIAEKAISGNIDLGSTSAVGDYAFYGCDQLTSVTGNVVSMVRGNCFQNCSRLATVNFPNLTYLGGSAFYGCSALTTVDLPSIQTIYNVAFNTGCGITTLILGPNFTAFGQRALQGCASLTTVVLRSTSMVSLNNVNNFNNTPFASGGTGGTIYVPQSLISTYEADTLWSQLSATFAKIEDSQYEISNS